jgi:hypothetical protein
VNWAARALGAGAAALLAGCPAPARYPGSELIGTFGFNASALFSDCSLYGDGGDNVPDGGFSFVATFSRNPGVWISISGAASSQSATFDGQYLTATYGAPRTFSECNEDCPWQLMVETLDVALLSGSQADLLGSQCPLDPLDGGVPPPGTKLGDGGVVQGPGTQASGFDAVMACGTLSDQWLPDAGCGCPACTWRYSVSGLRR